MIREAQRIDDPHDERVADYRSLREPRALRERGLFVVESRQCVRQVLTGGRFRLRSALLTRPALASLTDCLEETSPQLDLFVGEPAILRTIAGFDFHRGCVGLGERRDDDTTESLLDAQDASSTLIVLDEVSNPDNLGSIFRNALAFGAAGALLSPGSGDPLYRKAVRTSLGATVCLPFARAQRWPEDLAALRERGFGLVALTPDGDDIRTYNPTDGGMALVVGAEGAGIGAGVRRMCDRALSIPMAPGVDSLNAGTASGIALFHLTCTGPTAPAPSR